MPNSEKGSSPAFSFTGWLLLIVPLLLFILFMLAPLFQNMLLSFQKYNILGPASFTGMENYAQLFRHEHSAAVFYNTFFSPLLMERIFLLTAAPLALALLLLEVRLSGRIAIHILIALLLIYCGAAFFALPYASAATGLNALNILSDPEAQASLSHNLLLINGIVLSLPLGVVFYLCIMQGTLVHIQDKSLLYKKFRARALVLFILSIIGAAGYSLVSLESVNSITMGTPDPAGTGGNLITDAFSNAFIYMRIGAGAAGMQIIITVLLLLGLCLMLFLEGRKHSEISLHFGARFDGKLLSGVSHNGPWIAGIVFAVVVLILICIFLVLNLFLPVLGKMADIFAGGNTLPPALSKTYFASMLQSLRIALPTALICLVVSITAGFALGYFRPGGAKVFLIFTGTCLFITPFLLVIPCYLFFKNIAALDNITSLVLPSLLSPLGVIFFTWFFRGIRNWQQSLQMSGRALKPGATQKYALGALGLCALPVFAVYLFASLNARMLPYTFIVNPNLYPAPLFLAMSLQRDAGMITQGMKSALALLYPLPHLLPLAILVVSIIVVFPRLGLVIRKKSDPLPVLDPALAAGLTRDAEPAAEKLQSVDAAVLPGRHAWLSAIPLFCFACAFILIIPLFFSSGNVPAASAFLSAGITTAWIVYLVFVYQIHKALAAATTMTYPVSPLRAVLCHFIPFYNLYWIYKWTKEAALFVSGRSSREFIFPGAFLAIIYFSFAVALIVAITLLPALILISSNLLLLIVYTTLLGLSLYMSDQVKRALQ